MVKARMMAGVAMSIMAALAGCGPASDDRQATRTEQSAPVEAVPPAQPPNAAQDEGAKAEGGDAGAGARPTGKALPPADAPLRFVGLWAVDAGSCRDKSWSFKPESLHTPAGSACSFAKTSAVAGGYDIKATCTAEGPARSERLKIRFAESAQAMLFESATIADAGLIYCGPIERGL